MNAPQTATQPSGATQSIDWHKATNRMQRPKTVEFVVGNDAAQTLGAWICWQRWCWETHGRDLDHSAWMTGQQGKLTSGCFMQVVGWDKGEPVAMVEVRVGYDPCAREQMGFGDHAWVHPDYRQEGVMTALLDFLIDLGVLCNVYHFVAPVTAGEGASAPWLRSLYEKRQFQLSGIFMSRNPIREAA